MNIFYIAEDAQTCAEMHCSKHVVKMIIEYAQLLSTAHRLLDGEFYIDKTTTGRNIKRWRLPDDLDQTMMKATHINHPSSVWARTNQANYQWLYSLWYELCKEYTYRYGKIHSVETRLVDALKHAPRNIDKTTAFFPPTPAMPDEVKIAGNSLLSYRNYYNQRKAHIASWQGRVNNRVLPEWWQPASAEI